MLEQHPDDQYKLHYRIGRIVSTASCISLLVSAVLSLDIGTSFQLHNEPEPQTSGCPIYAERNNVLRNTPVL